MDNRCTFHHTIGDHSYNMMSSRLAQSNIRQESDGVLPIMNGEQLVAEAKAGSLDRVSYLLKRGIPPDTRDKDGTTALFWASCRGHAAICHALLISGADINCQMSVTKATALMACADRNQLACLEVLLRHKSVNVDQCSATGDTSLHMAAYRNYVRVVQRLIDHGANPCLLNKNRMTALDETLAQDNKECVALLRSYIGSFTKLGSPQRLKGSRCEDQWTNNKITKSPAKLPRSATDKLNLHPATSSITALDKLNLHPATSSITALDKLNIHPATSSITALDKLNFNPATSSITHLDKLNFNPAASSITALESMDSALSVSPYNSNQWDLLDSFASHSSSPKHSLGYSELRSSEQAHHYNNIHSSKSSHGGRINSDHHRPQTQIASMDPLSADSQYQSLSPTLSMPYQSFCPTPDTSHQSLSPSPNISHQYISPSPNISHQSISPSPNISHQSISPSPNISHQSISPSPNISHQSISPSPNISHQSLSYDAKLCIESRASSDTAVIITTPSKHEVHNALTKTKSHSKHYHDRKMITQDSVKCENYPSRVNNLSSCSVSDLLPSLEHNLNIRPDTKALHKPTVKSKRNGPSETSDSDITSYGKLEVISGVKMSEFIENLQMQTLQNQADLRQQQEHSQKLQQQNLALKEENATLKETVDSLYKALSRESSIAVTSSNTTMADFYNNKDTFH